MRLELKIVDLLANNKEKKFTINRIAKTLKEYYSFVHRTLNKLAKDGIISKDRVGKSYICSLSIGNEKTITLIQLNEIEKKDEFYRLNKELKMILGDFIESLSGVDTVILFGSHAKGTSTKESDIDILLVSRRKIRIDKITKEIYAKYGKDINTIIMTPHDFKKQKDKPLIKEILTNHYVLYGAEKFVSLVYK